MCVCVCVHWIVNVHDVFARVRLLQSLFCAAMAPKAKRKSGVHKQGVKRKSGKHKEGGRDRKGETKRLRISKPM